MRILIALETKNNFRENIKLNLESMGHDVEFYPKVVYRDYQYTVTDKLLNIFFQMFSKRNPFLVKRKKNHREKYEQNLKNDINNSKSYDLILVFRCDLLEDSLLIKFKEITKRMIAYQWDGAKRFPAMFTKIQFFDDFYSFNPADCEGEIKFIPNFYFDYKSLGEEEEKFGLTYIGFFNEERLQLLEKLGEKSEGMQCNFILKAFHSNAIQTLLESKFVRNLDEVYTYDQLLSIHNQSKVILDIKHPDHDGLSFRFFEALFLNKKIITTNKEVMNYDFYFPENIFILTNYNFDQLNDFYNIPYRKVEENIVNKYSFTNWFNSLLNNNELNYLPNKFNS